MFKIVSILILLSVSATVFAKGVDEGFAGTAFTVNGAAPENKLVVVSAHEEVVQWDCTDDNEYSRGTARVAESEIRTGLFGRSLHYECSEARKFYLNSRGERVEFSDDSIRIQNGERYWSIDLIISRTQVGTEETRRLLENAFNKIEEGCQVEVEFSVHKTPKPYYNPAGYPYLDADDINVICKK